ncbi:PDZK1-interacting protein 1 isoform X2 [Lepus europaeus]|uniref:PDZK1-interacting protein 1 isoform X2 n=1 Tax=Lepus europaeus TaxID=9983 RepID=UPI002B470CD4|nr:PDZK1-interacting protein 1 isoform X2 [Lepus europaeus]
MSCLLIPLLHPPPPKHGPGSPCLSHLGKWRSLGKEGGDRSECSCPVRRRPGSQFPGTVSGTLRKNKDLVIGVGRLQPWVQGLIAVAVFLVLVAIAFAVNHFWCQEESDPTNVVMTVGNKSDGVLVGMDGRYSSTAAGFRSSEHENAYENTLEEEAKIRASQSWCSSRVQALGSSQESPRRIEEPSEEDSPLDTARPPHGSALTRVEGPLFL